MCDQINFNVIKYYRFQTLNMACGSQVLFCFVLSFWIRVVIVVGWVLVDKGIDKIRIQNKIKVTWVVLKVYYAVFL